MKALTAFILSLALSATLSAQQTQTLYLSGTGLDDTRTWQFRCSAGNNSGRWGEIEVPSQWELQGYGEYDYGRKLDGPRTPLNEYGEYRYNFKVPASWKGGEVKIVFEGVMTDTEVKINGKSAGPVHQGGFYRFSYADDFDDRGFFTSRADNDLVWRYVRGIMHDARNTRACYLQLVESYLNDYSYPDIRALTMADNLDIETLADTPQVIFLTYDITDERMRGFVNRYVVKSIDALKKKAIDRGGPLEVPVLYLLDEFPTLQADPIYSTIFSVGRGWNIFITAIVQDYTQLETTYSAGVAQQIRNNCNLTFFLGTNDVHTARSVKEQMGRHIIPDPASYLRGEIRFIEDSLVSEDTLMHRMKPGEAYITINNHMPLQGYFELYFHCPEYTRYPQSAGVRRAAIDFEDAKYHYDTSWMTGRKKEFWE